MQRPGKGLKKRFIFFSVFIFSFYLSSFSSAAQVETYDQLLSAIRETRSASVQRIEQAVEREKVRESWEMGKLIDAHILLHQERAEYDKQVMARLSKDLGISESELYRMLKFARLYPKVAPGQELSWSHYRALLSLENAEEREAVAKEAAEKKWNRDQLREALSKRNVPSALSDEIAPLSALAEVKPGKTGVYRVVEVKGKKYFDLGFSIYHELSAKEAKKLKTEEAVNGTAGDLYTYRAEVTAVVDGDTFHALIDLGFGNILEQRLRLRQLDAPEILSADGKKAKALLEKVLTRDNGKLIIRTQKSDDQYGRYLVDVWVKDKNINSALLNSGVFTLRGDE